MRLIILVLLITCGSLPTVYGQDLLEWEHLQGSQHADSPGNYTGPNKYPSARSDAARWTDKEGNFWMFGGERYQYNNSGWLSDLWKYDTSQTEWLLIRGTNVTDSFGVYEGSDPRPGARTSALTWVDNAGKLWLFGGWGNGSATPATSRGMLGDLWNYDIAANKWTFVAGSRIGHYYNSYDAMTDSPTHRLDSMGWTDQNGDLYLFGGRGPVVSRQDDYYPSFLNDLWKYDIGANQWTLIQPYLENSQDERSARPTGRIGGMAWADNSGKFWLFGGVYYNGKPDFWQYDPATDLWESKGGADFYNEKQPKFVGQYPGLKSGGISWVDTAGDLWMFSHGGHGSFKDFWQYNISANGWTQMISSYEIYGDRGQSVTWIDKAGDLYVFGGYGTDITGEKGHLGDFLRMKAPARVPLDPPVDLVGIGEVKKVKLVEPTTGGAITQISYTANMVNAGDGGIPATTAKLFITSTPRLPDVHSATASVGEIQWKAVKQKPIKKQKPGKTTKPTKKKTLKLSGKLTLPGDLFNDYLYMYLDSGFAVDEEVESNNYIYLGQIQNWDD